MPCPVRPPAPDRARPPDLDRPDLDRLIAERVPEARFGVSQEVLLSETALGYEQAFHALAVARGVPDRCARFDRDADLTPFLGSGGPSWAAGLLAPCLAHVPARRAGLGTEELLVIPVAGVKAVLAWLPATASTLAISAPAACKRLTEVERALARSLLHAPSAEHELRLAPRVLGSL